MRTYSVWLKGMTQMIEVQADNVELERVEGAVFWNFVIDAYDNDSITVAAFPFEKVEYIVSSTGSEDSHAIPQDTTRTESGGLRLQQ